MKVPDCASDSYQKRGQVLESACQAADLVNGRGPNVLLGGVIPFLDLFRRVTPATFSASSNGLHASRPFAARLFRSVAHRPIDRDAFTETNSDSSTVTKEMCASNCVSSSRHTPERDHKYREDLPTSMHYFSGAIVSRSLRTTREKQRKNVFLMTVQTTGSCLCKGVLFEVAGKLNPILACHCMQCSKTSGAALP